MDCSRIKEQLEAYAIGALDPAEELLVVAHAHACPECVELIREYQGVTDALSDLLVDTVRQPLPKHFKGTLMDRIEAEELSLQPRKQPASSLPIPPKRRTWRLPARFPARLPARFPAPWPALAGAAVLVIALFFMLQSGIFSGRGGDSELQAIVQQQAYVREIVESDQTIQLVLESQEDELDATGRLYTNPDESALILTASGLPHPPEGEGYFVWYGSAEESELAGSLTVNEEGFGLLVFESDEKETMTFTQIALQPVDDLTTGKLVLRWALEQ